MQDGSVQSQIVEAADGKLDTSGELARCHALPKADSLPGANPIDGFGAKLGVVLDEALIEVARLKLVFRQQLFGLRRLLDAFEEVAKTCADLCGEDVPQVLRRPVPARGRPRLRPRKPIRAIVRRRPETMLPCPRSGDRGPAALIPLPPRSGSSTRACSRIWRRRFPQQTGCDRGSPFDNFDSNCQYVKSQGRSILRSWRAAGQPARRIPIAAEPFSMASMAKARKRLPGLDEFLVKRHTWSRSPEIPCPAKDMKVIFRALTAPMSARSEA